MSKLKRLPDWTARIIVRTHKGILLVRETNGVWKLPGGKKEPEDNSSLCTAKRELEEETGLPRNRGDFRLRLTRPKRQGKKNKYDVYYYEAIYPLDVIHQHLLPIGGEGEETCIIPYKELRARTDIDTAHASMLRRLNCLGPPNMGARTRRCT